MPLHPEILDRPAVEGARVVALALVAEAREQAARVGNPDDEEALHDFRVAVRRLRSTLRTWRDVLEPAVRDKDLRRLRRVARATGGARDVEVLLAWAAKEERGLPPSHVAAVEWLRQRLGAPAAREGVQEAVDGLARAADGIARRLRRSRVAAPGPAFGLALAGHIRDLASAVETLLARVETPANVAIAHRARIAGKRLRYVLEPLRDTPGVDSREAVKALKGLQDLLGDLHDAGAAETALRAARHDAEAERFRVTPAGETGGPGLRPGLLALELAASRRAARLFARLRDEVLPDRGASALAPAIAVAAALETRARRHDPPPPEARHLLDGLPPGARDWPGAVEEEAGWLPDSAGREGWRVLHEPDGDHHLREVATGSGARRFPVLEPADAATFEAYWPLTEGRRLRRIRRLDPDATGWRVDEYLDRPLVLAVGPAGEPAPPWLDAVWVRDVSDERAYRDEVIARRLRRG